MQLFVDMDGVLADFDAGYEHAFGVRPSKADDDVDWARVRDQHGFPAAHEVPEASDNKRAWVALNLGKHVEVVCCRSREKSHYATPGDVLIDDWEKYKHLWLAVGGRWITHRSAAQTISELAVMLTGNR